MSSGTRGWVEVVTSSYLRGWACRMADPRIMLSVLVNGIMVGSVKPWLARHDVKAAGHAERSGFFFSFARRLASGDRISVMDEWGIELKGSPVVYAAGDIAPARNFYEMRAAVAASFLRGRGLEIGAFTQPTDLPPDVDIRYYDRYPAERLRQHYDENCLRPLTAPDFCGDAQRLDGLGDQRFDFIIANHVIEHLEDPIGFLVAVAGRLTEGGRAMISAPDKRHCFDHVRELTPFEHLAEDHRLGPRRTRQAHYLEWVTAIERLEGQQARQRAAELDSADFSIHFHVWDATTFLHFLTGACLQFAIGLELIAMNCAHNEIVVVLQRTPAA